MKREPPIDHDQLAQAVYDAYRISVTGLTFVPVGYAAACYRLQAGSAAYFLKLWPTTTATAALEARRAQALRLARALYERNVYPRVSYPLRTCVGGLSATCAAGSFALFPFVEGSLPPAVWPPSLQDAWVEALVRLHRATPTLNDVLPARETFALSFVADLRRALDQLAHLGPHARPGLRAVRERMRAGQREIGAQIARLERLQQVVRRLDGPFVLCHTDMGSDNLLVNDRGQLYVLDWDEATVAPPEHDLHEARWTGLDRLIRGYRMAGGVSPLYLDHFAFYILRRALSDMTVRLVRMLTVHETDEKDEDARFGIEEWGFRQWAALDGTLEQIAAALEQSTTA